MKVAGHGGASNGALREAPGRTTLRLGSVRPGLLVETAWSTLQTRTQSAVAAGMVASLAASLRRGAVYRTLSDLWLAGVLGRYVGPRRHRYI